MILYIEGGPGERRSSIDIAYHSVLHAETNQCIHILVIFTTLEDGYWTHCAFTRYCLPGDTRSLLPILGGAEWKLSFLNHSVQPYDNDILRSAKNGCPSLVLTLRKHRKMSGSSSPTGGAVAHESQILISMDGAADFVRQMFKVVREAVLPR